MAMLSAYPARVFNDLSARFHWEKDFSRAVKEVLASLTLPLERNPQYEHERILERLIEPERVISFRVVWMDDDNRAQVSRAHRVQFNSALGPYKGGTRFHSSVSLDTLKSLAFEQTFKNALTGLPLGGGKGGADFQFRGRSEAELMRFSQSFMTELFHHIGPEIDVPAGDIGVGTREIGYLYGQYKRLTHRFNGVLTGKAVNWGGSRLRPEATGYGVAYFCREVLRSTDRTLEGKRIAISGFGNVAWGFAKKATELGAKVVTLSGPDGFVHDEAGLDEEKIDFMLEMRASGADRVEVFAERFGVPFYADKRPWGVKCDIAVPCAIENELDLEDAKRLVNEGCQTVIEAANMPTTLDAMSFLKESGVVFAPGKAANAGGVAVSGLEMTQNRSGQSWGEKKVDASLSTIMKDIHRICAEAADQCGRPGDYVLGANVAGFMRVAQAMIDQGPV